MKPITPVHIEADDEDVEESEIEMVHAFSIGDEDYYVPAVVPPSITAQYLVDVNRGDSEQAMAAALATYFGDGLEALAQSTKVTDKQMASIMGMASEVLMGAFNKSLGKSSRAQRRSRG